MQYNHFITGRVIRELREQRGLTRDVLSGLAAVSRSHLAEIETGPGPCCRPNRVFLRNTGDKGGNGSGFA